MAKLILSAEPSFTAPVAIPVPGGKSVNVAFTFKWRGKDEAKAWLDSVDQASDSEIISQAATGWELDDAFTPDNVELLCQKYAGAARAVFATYLQELGGARAKN